MRFRVGVWICWLLPFLAEGQSTRQSAALWLEAVFQQKLHPNWSLQADIQYRRRSDWFSVPGGSPFLGRHPVQGCFRPWVHFEKVKNLRFSISPLGYWRNFPVRDKQGSRPGNHELRTSLQTVYFQKGMWSWHVRGRYELRYRSDGAATGETLVLAGEDFPIGDQLSRLRIQGKISRELKPNGLQVGVSYEWFWGLGSATAPKDRWDQNRINFSVSRKWGKHMRWEVGYLAHWVTRQSDPQWNHCLALLWVWEGKKPVLSSDAGGGD